MADGVMLDTSECLKALRTATETLLPCISTQLGFNFLYLECSILFFPLLIFKPKIIINHNISAASRILTHTLLTESSYAETNNLSTQARATRNHYYSHDGRYASNDILGTSY